MEIIIFKMLLIKFNINLGVFVNLIFFFWKINNLYIFFIYYYIKYLLEKLYKLFLFYCILFLIIDNL